jgi:hypothetical protein
MDGHASPSCLPMIRWSSNYGNYESPQASCTKNHETYPSNRVTKSLLLSSLAVTNRTNMYSVTDRLTAEH